MTDVVSVIYDTVIRVLLRLNEVSTRKLYCFVIFCKMSANIKLTHLTLLLQDNEVDKFLSFE